MVYILLIPFDVYATVRQYENIFEFKNPIIGGVSQVKIYDLYFASYILMVFLSFIGLPFSYFYA